MLSGLTCLSVCVHTHTGVHGHVCVSVCVCMHVPAREALLKAERRVPSWSDSAFDVLGEHLPVQVEEAEGKLVRHLGGGRGPAL